MKISKRLAVLLTVTALLTCAGCFPPTDPAFVQPHNASANARSTMLAP
ncbi:hypothetical protein [Lysobacter sp. CA199]